MTTNTVKTFDRYGSTIDIEKCGRILGPRLWAQLAAEYLDESTANSEQARENAYLLARHVRLSVDCVGVTHEGLYEYEYGSSRWLAVPNGEPYGSLEEMSVPWLEGDVTQVSNLHCDHPVWSEGVNVRFRIWHDTGHLVTGKGFDPDGELDLFAIQSIGLGGEGPLVDALFSESVYQLAACIALGGFPDVQYVQTPGPVGRLVLRLLQERYK